MNREDDRLIAEWEERGQPEIPLQEGVTVYDVPKFLAYCRKTKRWDEIDMMIANFKPSWAPEENNG